MKLYHYKIADTKDYQTIYPIDYELLGIPSSDFNKFKKDVSKLGYDIREGKLSHRAERERMRC